MPFENLTLVEMLQLYTTLTSTTKEEGQALFDNLKLEANRIQPDIITSDYMTSYEAFLLVEKLSPVANVMPLDIAGYDDTPADLSIWDPDVPVDDKNQYPDDECIDLRREFCDGNVKVIDIKCKDAN